MQCKPGDIVMLKSGGPKMTVASIRPNLDNTEVIAICIWFPAAAEEKRASFPLETLELVQEK